MIEYIIREQAYYDPRKGFLYQFGKIDASPMLFDADYASCVELAHKVMAPDDVCTVVNKYGTFINRLVS